MSDPAEAPASPLPEEPPMEIHKPKPVHSWRELLTELCEDEAAPAVRPGRRLRPAVRGTTR